MALDGAVEGVRDVLGQPVMNRMANRHSSQFHLRNNACSVVFIIALAHDDLGYFLSRLYFTRNVWVPAMVLNSFGLALPDRS